MDWDNARGADATARTQIEALFAALYRHLQKRETSNVNTMLDLAAWFDVPTSSAFSVTDRPLAIVHRAAHRLEDTSPTGLDAKGGGALQSVTTEKGSRSYAVVPVSEYLSPSDAALRETAGGRAYLQLRDSKAFSAPRVR